MSCSRAKLHPMNSTSWSLPSHRIAKQTHADWSSDSLADSGRSLQLGMDLAEISTDADKLHLPPYDIGAALAEGCVASQLEVRSPAREPICKRGNDRAASGQHCT